MIEHVYSFCMCGLVCADILVMFYHNLCTAICVLRQVYTHTKILFKQILTQSKKRTQFFAKIVLNTAEIKARAE